MTFAAMISAIVGQLTENSASLYTYGPMGVVLGWFMWRGEKLVGEIRSLAHRIDGLTRAMLMDMVNRDTCGDQAKRMAQEEIAKIERRMRHEP